MKNTTNENTINNKNIFFTPKEIPTSLDQYKEVIAFGSHEEGGCFKQMLDSTQMLSSLNDGSYAKKENAYHSQQKEHKAGTSIYYALEEKNYSCWHRIPFDEMWHHYDGYDINIHTIDDEGNFETLLLGNPEKNKETASQVVIPAGRWQAAEIVEKNTKKSFCLAGCTVFPGFDYRDWQLADKNQIEKLIKLCPQQQKKIVELAASGLKLKQESQNIELAQQEEKEPVLNTKIKLKEPLPQNPQPHKTGGKFQEKYRSDYHVKSPSFYNGEQRNTGTFTLHRLADQEYSCWHKIAQNRVLHYYNQGAGAKIHIITPDGKLETIKLGNPLKEKDANFQVIVKGNSWVAVEPLSNKEPVIMGCTVVPGLAKDGADVKLANKNDVEKLLENYPEKNNKELIIKFVDQNIKQELESEYLEGGKNNLKI